jgi:carbon-monoxide dehydrogenase medium subunit
VVPESLPDAVSILSRNPEAKILAGGQSLIPMMRFRLASPALLIDLNCLDGLEYLREEDGWLKIGALTRENAIDHAEFIRQRYPLLNDTTQVIADPLVRNRATVGGNLAHADPANDHPATMLAYNAQVIAIGPKGERVIPIKDFFVSLFESALAHDEIITEIRIPFAAPHSGGAYVKLERKVGDYATAAVAAQIQLGEDGRCITAGIGLTNVGLIPIKVTKAEEALRGKPIDEAAIKQAAQLASEAAEPVDDQRGSETYKRAVIRTLTSRALYKALERATGGIQ